MDATIRYAAIPDGRKLDIAVRVLAGAGPATVICHSGATAEHAARELAVRGFTDPCVVARADDLDGFVLSWEAPFDTSELAERHGSGGAILVRPRELAHLRRIAAETGAGLAPLPPTDAPATALDAFRDRLRDAARTGDLEAQLLVVAPLLEELSMAEIAAAATLLARQ
ncbi:MAG: hypothetical protein GWN71_10015, partial [Gammaproteobacteria bacterium]|nr:hypothetical protein [Gemmatimonadota bacterium]NIU73899.1 hypothetical protein [Gammaproteobacteria bacterium]